MLITGISLPQDALAVHLVRQQDLAPRVRGLGHRDAGAVAGALQVRVIPLELDVLHLLVLLLIVARKLWWAQREQSDRILQIAIKAGLEFQHLVHNLLNKLCEVQYLRDAESVGATSFAARG